MESIYNISVKVNSGEDFYLLLGDFLDAFYKASFNRMTDMINEPPVDMAQQEYVPFLSATAHKLALDNNLTPPQWAFQPRLY